ncbi:MAG: hypothetical protein A2Y10_00765 [Planctomycetes bacterium GWF2_41_51]|nr:MAG: hypothetical protein A2Y10_00765 [Planctomycetes bacterium GWF2_41_51]HBG26743.1 hypothetical protein [Phycisphaerales bacterium]
MRSREKQLKVIRELFEGNEGEKKVLEDNNVSEQTWRRWLADKHFISKVTNKIETAKLANQILLAKLMPVVTTRLLQLCSSENEDVSRKACLTLVELQNDKEINLQFEEKPEMQIEPETASKILAVLAERRREKRNKIEN